MVISNLKRVVVTGMGAITPLGNNVTEYWNALLQGRSGIGPITKFDASNHACQIAAEVKDFDPTDYLERKQAKRIDRFAQFAIAASQSAIADSGLVINDLNADRVGVIIGSGIGGMRIIEEQQQVYLKRGPDRCSPFTIPMMLGNMAAGLTAIHTGAKGPNLCTTTACAAGSNAIGEAFRLIRHGYATAIICGGTESAITPVAVAGFTAAKALSTANEKLTRACCPFDRDRDGFVMGEGAGILILEELESALNRKANIYGEMVGYGTTCDAYHMTAPSPGGMGAAKAIELALKDADLFPNEVSYINAHGTSTPANDATETSAIKKALGDRAFQTAISSTKSMTGHLMGGSGGIEAIAAVMAVASDRIPPTINLDHPDPKCDLDYVPHQSRQQQVNVALSNSFAFGGNNATLVFQKFKDQFS